MTSRCRPLDWVLEGGVLGVLLVSPLPFGSVRPWAHAALESAIWMLGILVLVRGLLRGELVIRRHPLLWPGLTLLALGVGQVVIPSASASPYATWQAVSLYAAYLAFLLVLCAALDRRAAILRLVAALFCWGVVLATLGLFQQAHGRALILGFPKQHYLDRLTATFVNPNHQALYFSVILFLGLGLLLPAGRRAAANGGPRVDRPQAWAIGSGGRILLAGGLVLIATALVLTASRGGVVSTLAGLGVVLALVLSGRAGARVPLALVLAPVAFVAYASTFALDLIMDRFAVAAKELHVARWTIWRASLDVVAEAPFWGVGFGAFEDVFRRFHPETLWHMHLVDYAHNDYLQLLAEGGLLSLLLLGWGGVALSVFVLTRWAGRQDAAVRGLVVGGVGALTSVIVHSTTDFGLHMPANALLVTAVLALLPVVATLRMHRIGYRVDLREWQMLLASPGRRALGSAAVAVLVVLAFLPVPRALADWHLGRAALVLDAERRVGALPQTDLARGYRELVAAARLDAENPRVQSALAGAAGELARRAWDFGIGPDGRLVAAGTTVDRLRASKPLLATTYQAYMQSLRSRPGDAATHERFGWFLGRLEKIRRAVSGAALDSSMEPDLTLLLGSDDSLLPRALEHFRLAIRWDPRNPGPYRSLGLFALVHVGEIQTARQLAVESFNQALRMDRWLLGEVVERVLSSPGGDLDLLRAAVPPDLPTVIDLAWHLERRGQAAGATAMFESAVKLAAGAEQEAEARLAYGQALLSRRDSGKALVQVRQALVLTPRNPEVFFTLATAYEGLQQWRDAEAAFGSAVSLADMLPLEQTNRYRARLADLLARRSEVDRALALRQQILRDAPNDAWSHLGLGRVLEQRGNLAEAFDEYRLAKGLGLKDGEVTLEVARAFVRQGLDREAAEAYEAVARLLPTRVEARVELADLYVRTGRRTDAVEQYRWVLARQPEYEAVRRALTSLSPQAEEVAGHRRQARP